MRAKQKARKVKKCEEPNKPSVEEIYKGKDFQMPKEKTFETIFEEPKLTRSGSEQLTSMKKFKRFLEFREEPSSVKLRKRRKRAKTLTKNYFNVSQKLEFLDNLTNSTMLLQDVKKKCRNNSMLTETETYKTEITVVEIKSDEELLSKNEFCNADVLSESYETESRDNEIFVENTKTELQDIVEITETKPRSENVIEDVKTESCSADIFKENSESYVTEILVKNTENQS